MFFDVIVIPRYFRGFWLFFMVFHFLPDYHCQWCHFFARPSGPMFLQYVWGSLTIICDYFWWPPTIGPAMRCLRFIVQDYLWHTHTYRGPDLPIFTTQGSQKTIGWQEMLSWHNTVMVNNVGSNCQETLYYHLLTFVLPSCLGNELMIKEIKTHRGPRGKNCNVLLYNSPYLKDSPPKSPFCLKFYSPPLPQPFDLIQGSSQDLVGSRLNLPKTLILMTASGFGRLLMRQV